MELKKNFQLSKSFYDRQCDVNKLLAKYPNNVPVFIYNSPLSKLPKLKTNKFNIPNDMNLNEFKYILTKKLLHLPSDGYHFYVGVNYLDPEMSFKDLYNTYKEDDGVLYIEYSEMNSSIKFMDDIKNIFKKYIGNKLA